MKILMVTMAMNIGGAETHILELCRELHRMGHDVTLASNGGVYADELISLGIRHVKLALHSKSPKCVMDAYHGLENLIKTEKYDIVHAHARIPAFICGLLHDRIRMDGNRKFRFVTTAHLNFSVNPLWRRISRWGERTMAVSEDITDYLVREYSFPRDRIHTTINGVDCAKFSPDTGFSSVLGKHGLDPSHRRIVYMSRLDADRADPAFRLLHITEKLSSRYPDTDLLIVGGGTEYDKIRSEAEEVNRKIGRNYVVTTGPVSNVNEYCAAADVFIGVSRSLFEAMASSKPVIAAGNQGALGIFDETKIEAAVDTNFCCRGFDQATEDDIFRDVSALLDMPADELRAMGEYNRRFIEERYTAARMASDYLAMYEKTLASPCGFFGAADMVISGYYGFGNLGDESLLDIIASAFADEKRGVKIAALTRKPKADSQRTGLRCISRINIPAVVHNFRRSRLLISGGGSLLQDATSRRSLTYYAGVISTAHLCGMKTAVFANGIGPVNYESNRRLTKKVLEKADHISVRDPESAAELERLGITREITVRADPAFLIEASGGARLRKIKSESKISGNYFVVSLRQMPLGRRKTAETRALDEKILAEACRFCRAVSEKYSLLPVILPMQESHDRALCESLCNAVPGSVICSPETASDLVGIMKGAEFVVGMRLHAMIFASSAGVPVIGLSYDPKIDGIMKALGQPYSISLDDTSAISDNVCTAVDAVMQNRDGIAAELARKAEEMRKLCLEDVKAAAELL